MSPDLSLVGSSVSSLSSPVSPWHPSLKGTPEFWRNQVPVPLFPFLRLVVSACVCVCVRVCACVCVCVRVLTFTVSLPEPGIRVCSSCSLAVCRWGLLLAEA